MHRGVHIYSHTAAFGRCDSKRDTLRFCPCPRLESNARNQPRHSVCALLQRHIGWITEMIYCYISGARADFISGRTHVMCWKNGAEDNALCSGAAYAISHKTLALLHMHTRREHFAYMRENLLEILHGEWDKCSAFSIVNINISRIKLLFCSKQFQFYCDLRMLKIHNRFKISVRIIFACSKVFDWHRLVFELCYNLWSRDILRIETNSSSKLQKVCL